MRIYCAEGGDYNIGKQLPVISRLSSMFYAELSKPRTMRAVPVPVQLVVSAGEGGATAWVVV